MSDLLDKAQQVEEKAREIALKNALSERSTHMIVEDFRHGRVVRVCAECDCEIPEKRIQAMPSAALCIECQSILEAKCPY